MLLHNFVKTNEKSPFRGRPASTALYLNNRVFLSWNYRLIVFPRKFDVLNPLNTKNTPNNAVFNPKIRFLAVMALNGP